ncbi:RTC4-like domain-containing protein [Roridomyces roridus]|uniref:Restriction of telomere capping protein 4 n=1 Tax=Roridomyces roridus TaxID=1738132 RepID=A0AAD7BZ21_9AGAR|nr:RTC4-like domain-containing protein [Roridomyces roridus]KAJ7634675.1 RTC4-like domain-containing protein [Roridomyces roridus]KAJ7647000.1 RTC4-like domain-containing protein [Roridomyces roridus]
MATKFSKPRQQRTRGFDIYSLPRRSVKSNLIRRLSSPGPGGAGKKSRLEPFDTIQAQHPDHLCPHCDSELPQPISLKLRTLLASASKMSQADPRLHNVWGRTTSTAIAVSVCSQHDFELKVLPEALANGWPTEHNWYALGDRVSWMEPELRPIFEERTGPREACIFWQQLRADTESLGSLAKALSARGQYSRLQHMQTGYYGEMGATVIHRTLMKMFPFSEALKVSVDPMTWMEFIINVLTPEVAMRLIMEDSEDAALDAAGAVHILRASSTYGVQMFPADE